MAKHEIKLDVSKRDMAVIARIADRARMLALRADRDFDLISTEMDLCCIHANYGLRLQSLLEANDFNFLHDVLGIERHLNRETGKLENFFMPRFAKAIEIRENRCPICGSKDCKRPNCGER